MVLYIHSDSEETDNHSNWYEDAMKGFPRYIINLSTLLIRSDFLMVTLEEHLC